ncbi:SLAC1 anion channel family protein [Primorskyibacter aestuariivivens]|uniref:SLAC1 anion channel family protein n=1 Tax=Primorskyibacter aestuariivivens TaxID=1888912 RepID=UPI002300156E|nr:SLAC1 anion channel family protein [Primorskyibacter aestuariivivens]MDA7429527.1 SLAC1 anion channel family protein [Primorskyibacter aestuariivivens]
MTHSSEIPSGDAAAPRLVHFPIPLFASVMGFAGLTLVLHQAELVFGWGHWGSTLCLALTIFDFVLVGFFYVLKALRHPGAVVAEWRHPVRLAFFPAISISLLLIATALRPHASGLAEFIWLIGAIAQGALTLAVISGWIGKRAFQPMHISPAWFVPAVGNVVVPVAGVGFGYTEVSWLFFATGMLFWILLLTLVLNRLIFHDPLPARLLPTLVILIAPPAVGFLAWLQLNGGEIDALARMLFYGAVLFAAIVCTQMPGFLRLPFALSWWALSFPVAALSLAALRYGTLIQQPGIVMFGAVGVALVVVIVVALTVRTIRAVFAGQICVPE